MASVLSDRSLNSITAVEVGGTHYVVATTVDQTIVVTDITEPANPSSAVSNISTTKRGKESARIIA